MPERKQVGVIGAAVADRELRRLAEETGALVAERGWVLVCGGLGGVMEAAARGAKSRGGTTVGILPGPDRQAANPAIDIVIPTEMGHARNALVVRSADALVAIGGGWGTLSEIALARKMGKKVVSLRSWNPSPEVEQVATPQQAIAVIEGELSAPHTTER